MDQGQPPSGKSRSLKWLGSAAVFPMPCNYASGTITPAGRLFSGERGCLWGGGLSKCTLGPQPRLLSQLPVDSLQKHSFKLRGGFSLRIQEGTGVCNWGIGKLNLWRTCIRVTQGAGRKGQFLGVNDRGWDGWLASSTQWTWVWASPGSWWWTGRPGILQSMGSQRVGHNWRTELNWMPYSP